MVRGLFMVEGRGFGQFCCLFMVDRRSGLAGFQFHVHCFGKLVLRCKHQASCAVEVWKEAEDEGGGDRLDGVIGGCCVVGGWN